MTHPNIIIDSDTHFLIDAATRQIRNTASSKISVMQNDHNSERLTFSIPRFIEGHDMSTSDTIEIHYINVDAASKEQTTGIYEPDDVKVETSGDSEIVTFSWLLSRNATQHVGSLTFVVRFACFKDDVVDYAWHTAPFSGMSVGETLDCSGAIEGEYLDIIAAWEKEHIEPLQKDVEELKNNTDEGIPVIELNERFDPDTSPYLCADFGWEGTYKVVEKYDDAIIESTLYVHRIYGNDVQWYDHAEYLYREGEVFRIMYGDECGWESTWEKISVSQGDIKGFATKTDLEDAIGDIETSLENIIKKYGLGGDSV